MLTECPIRMSIPARDIQRAKAFYAEQLGMHPAHETPFGLIYACENTFFTIIQHESAGKMGYSLMTWLTKNLDSEVALLRARGVIFEEYDLPDIGLKTVNGIAELGGDRIAWFKDSEGNLLAVAQVI
ncbi:MAG: VOC family protein [bacterium]|nr:VOC family protein [bacterium]